MTLFLTTSWESINSQSSALAWKGKVIKLVTHCTHGVTSLLIQHNGTTYYGRTCLTFLYGCFVFVTKWAKKKKVNKVIWSMPNKAKAVHISNSAWVTLTDTDMWHFVGNMVWYMSCIYLFQLIWSFMRDERKQTRTKCWMYFNSISNILYI